MRDDNGKAKTLYIHKLVALAFLPCDDPTRRVVHRDKNRSNNRLENLEWVANVKEKKKALDFVLQEEIVNRIQQVHVVAQKKGLRDVSSDSYLFATKFIEEAIEAYIMKNGLRKIDRRLMKKLFKHWKLRKILQKSFPHKKITIKDNNDGSQTILIL